MEGQSKKQGGKKLTSTCEHFSGKNKLHKIIKSIKGSRFISEGEKGRFISKGGGGREGRGEAVSKQFSASRNTLQL